MRIVYIVCHPHTKALEYFKVRISIFNTAQLWSSYREVSSKQSSESIKCWRASRVYSAVRRAARWRPAQCESYTPVAPTTHDVRRHLRTRTDLLVSLIKDDRDSRQTPCETQWTREKLPTPFTANWCRSSYCFTAFCSVKTFGWNIK